jgi:YidC/Oxa1 family membrane protein insertase
MDSKRMFAGILLITALGLGWQSFLYYQYAKHPEWKRPGEQTTVVPTAAATASTESPAGPATQMAQAAPTSAPTTQSGWQIVPPPGPKTATTIGSEHYQDAKCHIALSIVSTGAALDGVVLNEYHQEVDNPELFTFQNPYDLDVARTRSMETVAIDVDGNILDLWNQNWTLLNRTDLSAQYAVDVVAGTSPIVRVTKTYAIEPAQTDSTTPQGYEVHVDYSLTNLTSGRHQVSLKFNGPTIPKAETARQETEIVAGYNDDGTVKLVNQPLSYFHSDHSNVDFAHDPNNLPLLWMGASSNYFNAIVRPEKSGMLAGAVASVLNPDSTVDQRFVAIGFTTENIDLPPGGSAAVPLRVFFGPKLRNLIEKGYYHNFPNGYDQTLVMVNGICGFCTFPALINVLVDLLRFFHLILFDWGLAIIMLVFMVRAILHPITKRSQVNMMRMQKLSPEMERLKKKFADDPKELQRAQVELYKSVGFTPVLGCLPMFLQMPIFIALWRALQTTFELRQAPFLEFFHIHFTWIRDLSQPDALVKFANPIALPFGWHLASINVLPMAMAVVTFINQKYFMPRPAAMSPEQEQQQKMMTWMTLVFPFMFYTFPSGLNLYYLTTTALGIIESKIVRKHIKDKEAEEAAKGPVIVDAGKSSRAMRARKEPPKGPVKKGFMQRLQEKAEEMSRQAEQKRKREEK